MEWHSKFSPQSHFHLQNDKSIVKEKFQGISYTGFARSNVIQTEWVKWKESTWGSK